MTLIELGEISSGSDPERPVPPPRRADIRRIAVLLIAVLTVLTVTGSERPEPHGLPELWSTTAPGDQFVLTADTLYLQSSSVPAELIAHDAGTGAVRWRRPVQQQGYWISAEVPGLVLVPEFTELEVTDDNGNTYVQPTVTTTRALDPATGRELWTSPGESSMVSGDLIQLSIWDDRATVASFRIVRRLDGTVAWTLDPDEKIANWTATGADPSRPDRFITATEAGDVEVRRMDTGAVLIRKRLPWLSPEPLPGAFSQLYSVGGVLFVIRDNAGKQIVDAYEPETLAPLWSRTISSFNNFFDCGRSLCLNSGPGTIDALDPRTGLRRWTSGGWDWAREIRPGTLLTEPYQGGFSGLVSSTDGRKILEFPIGTTLLDRTSGQVVTVGANLGGEQRGAPVSQPGADGGIIMRGLIRPISDIGCQLAAGRLACGVSGGGISVTDVG